MKGRTIAIMNQANFIAIMMSSVVYWLFDRIAVRLPGSATGDYQLRCPIFAMTALLMIPVLLLYRPSSQSAETDRDRKEIDKTC